MKRPVVTDDARPLEVWKEIINKRYNPEARLLNLSVRARSSWATLQYSSSCYRI